MFAKQLELIVQKLRTHKRISQTIFECLFEIFQSDCLLKFPNTFSFSLTHPTDQHKYLMIANFPDEDDFAQIQVVDERFAQSVDLKVISNFDQLVQELEALRKPRAEKFNVKLFEESDEFYFIFLFYKHFLVGIGDTSAYKNASTEPETFLKEATATYYHQHIKILLKIKNNNLSTTQDD